MSERINLRQEKCRSCSAPVFMVEHERTGKRAPINADPVPDGNIVFDLYDDGQVAYRILEIGDRANFAPRYTSHFATCPNSNAHRRRGKS